MKQNIYMLFYDKLEDKDIFCIEVRTEFFFIIVLDCPDHCCFKFDLIVIILKWMWGLPYLHEISLNNPGTMLC